MKSTYFTIYFFSHFVNEILLLAYYDTFHKGDNIWRYTKIINKKGDSMVPLMLNFLIQTPFWYHLKI